jgi:hypothetical protein
MSEGATKPVNPVVAEAHDVDTYHGKLSNLNDVKRIY